MFDRDGYLNDLISSFRASFGDRLLYMGLQGSWLRGEANENSDIDEVRRNFTNRQIKRRRNSEIL